MTAPALDTNAIHTAVALLAGRLRGHVDPQFALRIEGVKTMLDTQPRCLVSRDARDDDWQVQLDLANSNAAVARLEAREWERRYNELEQRVRAALVAS